MEGRSDQQLDRQVQREREDERSIHRLVARYCHAVAEGDVDAWAATWVEDGEWVVLGRSLRGRAAIVEHYRKLVGPVRWVVQVAQNGLVDVRGDAAEGRWLILEWLQWERGGGGQNVGQYRDRYRRGEDGEWRFARRELAGLYFGPPDLSADPPRGAT